MTAVNKMLNRWIIYCSFRRLTSVLWLPFVFVVTFVTMVYITSYLIHSKNSGELKHTQRTILKSKPELRKNDKMIQLQTGTEKQKSISKMKPILHETKNTTINRRVRKKQAHLPNVSNEITLVTAYWDIGHFKKGDAGTFGPFKYVSWIKIFRYILNPVIFYTDSKKFANLMLSLRNCSILRTKVNFISRNSSWAFQNIKKIEAIYSKPDYPIYHPNTVIPEYACTQHAKYDVIARAAKDNAFRTKYFAWLDIGYFRDRKSKDTFRLNKPVSFNDSLIAMNQLKEKQDDSSFREIFLRSQTFWVGGGLFLGRYDVIIDHALEFKRAVDFFINRQLMNTDQQILQAMYTQQGRTHFKPKTSIQIYESNMDWFYLGNKMLHKIPEVGNICRHG